MDTPDEILASAAAAGDRDAFAALSARHYDRLFRLAWRLTGGTSLNDWGWERAIALALDTRGDDPFGYRVQAVNLVRTAQALSAR